MYGNHFQVKDEKKKTSVESLPIVDKTQQFSGISPG